MSHDIEWRHVLAGSQVWANGYAWLVEMHIAGTVTLYSPALDKRHVGTPKPWTKVAVLTPDDKRYRKGWEEKFIETSPVLVEEDGMRFAEMLLTVKLGGMTIGWREDGKPWGTPHFANLTAHDQRLHLIFFHRTDSSDVHDVDLVRLHVVDSTISVEHEHGELQ